MTSDSVYPGDDPRQLLAGARELAQRVRGAQRATWFPLLVLAALTFAAIPLYRFSTPRLRSCAAVGAGRVCTVAPAARFVYWPAALVLAYAVIAAFYLRRSRARGVGTRVRPYVIAGVILAFAVTGLALWAFGHPLAPEWELLARLGSPACAIGLALLVLAWAERNRALLILAAGYLAVVLIPVTFGWDIQRAGWVFLPRLVVGGSVLLAGGIGFAIAQRPWRRTG
jgi:hypothetical protein